MGYLYTDKKSKFVNKEMYATHVHSIVHTYIYILDMINILFKTL